MDSNKKKKKKLYQGFLSRTIKIERKNMSFLLIFLFIYLSNNYKKKEILFLKFQ